MKSVAKSTARWSALPVALGALAALLTSGTAAAWDGPLCAVDETLGEPPPIAVEVALPMCAIDMAPVPVPAELGGVIEDAEARRALVRTRELLAAGRHGEALLSLRVVQEAFPDLEDRLALFEGEIHLAAGDPREARVAFERARTSIDSTVATRARVGRVEAFIALGHRDAGRELQALMRRYASLPPVIELRFALAVSKEESGDVNEAVRIYRDIDLMHPGSLFAEESRARMEAIAADGTRVRGLTLLQQVDRAERLVRQGPMPMARTEVARLEGETLPVELRGRLAYAAARIARVEGNWEEARRYSAIANGAPIGDAERREQTAGRAADMARAATSREQESARRNIARLKGRWSWGRVPTLRLRNMIEIAARAGLREEANGAVEALAARSNLHPQTAFDAAILASGIADDAHLVDLLARIKDHPRFRVNGRYHYARALERAGRYVDAEVELLRVAQLDRSETRWYAMLSEQRLWAVRESMLCRCGPNDVTAQVAAGSADAENDEPMVLAALSALPDPTRREGPPPEGRRDDSGALAPSAPPDLDALAEALAPIVDQHGEAYPWLGRAHELLRLGDSEAAADELHEVFLAWRAARGRTLRRTGLEAVFRGVERPRVFVDWTTKRARKQMHRSSARVLADISSALGDEGTAVGFGGWSRVVARPRAYEALVEEVAGRHGLDPNLLLAVMRVESVYQRRIVSFAGAVGLMQIMPRTGRLIADAVGRRDFTTDDLLNPETNLDFAAWYLSSLIERFDGRLPLAIASYNGGPHNVRRWMRGHYEDMPLDAFLERIPFTETHRYVRRVLTHYAAYRGQENLPMQRLSLELPNPGRDVVAF